MTIEDASGMKASDSAARGLNHRVGRTSRAGSPGCAVSLMTAQEVRLVKRYQSELHIVMRAGRLREGVFDVGDES